MGRKLLMTAQQNSGQANYRIALVLQGGGALGAYQAGVFQALHEHDLTPNWVVGTSIGAINAALIAGNEPDLRVQRLREFWNDLSHKDLFDMKAVPDPVRQFNISIAALDAMLRGVPGFFLPRPMNPFHFRLPVLAETASFYDTSPLRETLAQLVDFDYLNQSGGMRLTVNAVKVTTGKLYGFDNTRQPIGIEHIMASGALPPGFPGIRLDGDLYWDGGLFSNTPLETVLDDEPHTNTLCFMVDLWNSEGPEPTTYDEVQTRQKDILYASRSKRHIEAYLRLHQLRCTAQNLYNKLPAELQKDAEEELAAIGSNANTFDIVRLAYKGRDWHRPSKDINFSLGSIEWRWEQGYLDATQAILNAEWASAAASGSGIVVHELIPVKRDRREVFSSK